MPELGSGGGDLGESGNARKKTFFSIDVFPKGKIEHCKHVVKRPRPNRQRKAPAAAKAR